MATKNYRIEKDSLGEVRVPKKALWGAQTQRAVNNFPISGIKMDFPFTKSFINSLGLIKDAAARANSKLKLLSFFAETHSLIFFTIASVDINSLLSK